MAVYLQNPFVPEGLDLFDPVLAQLPRLVSRDVIPDAGLPPAADAGFLHSDAHPVDPGQAVIVAVKKPKK